MITIPKKPEHSKRWVFQFQVSDKIFGLETGVIQEVVHMAELITPPGLPSFLFGFINIEGQAIPVICLSALFNLSCAPVSMYTSLVILKTKQIPMALIAERVLNVVSIEETQLRSLDDESIFNQCIIKAGQNDNGDNFYLLSPQQILLAQEKCIMIEFQATTQRRLEELQTEDAANGQ